MPMGRSFPGFGNRSGFTVVELLAVVFILALFSGILSVRIGGLLSGGDLRLATRMMINEVSRLRGLAAHTHREQVLGLNMDTNRFYSLEAPARERTLEKRSLPAGVTLEDVVILSRGKIQGGEARIRFFPNGCVDRSLIHLRNERDEAYTLEINPLTGHIKIHDTYIDQKT
ncbi:MAG: prepilin-type N-terminal cleavage/methylation domain-containing protein [Deltaproteobacteria bacterium]|nr:prepilin-type N-terminal cleavage/methylation domain-containing protein [Deltaproteobacteria bacterium]